MRFLSGFLKFKSKGRVLLFFWLLRVDTPSPLNSLTEITIRIRRNLHSDWGSEGFCSKHRILLLPSSSLGKPLHSHLNCWKVSPIFESPWCVLQYTLAGKLTALLFRKGGTGSLSTLPDLINTFESQGCKVLRCIFPNCSYIFRLNNSENILHTGVMILPELLPDVLVIRLDDLYRKHAKDCNRKARSAGSSIPYPWISIHQLLYEIPPSNLYFPSYCFSKFICWNWRDSRSSYDEQWSKEL